MGIAIYRTDGRHDLRCHLSANDPHVQAVLTIARELVEKYTHQVVDGPREPKHPSTHLDRQLAGKWKPLHPNGCGEGHAIFAEDHSVGSVKSGSYQPYYGTLTFRHGPADANGQIRTSEPRMTITTKVTKPNSGGICEPYSVRALTLERGSLRIGHFRVI